MRRHAPEDRRHGAFGSPFGVVQRRIISDGSKQCIVFNLVSAFGILVRVSPDRFAIVRFNTGLQARRAGCALKSSAAFVPGTGNVPDLTVQFRTVGVFVFDIKMVKNITVAGPFSDERPPIPCARIG
jgi:hypothetical protein